MPWQFPFGFTLTISLISTVPIANSRLLRKLGYLTDGIPIYSSMKHSNLVWIDCRASFANDKDNYDLNKCYAYLETAMTLRWETVPIEKILRPPIEAYNFHVECQTLQELQSIKVRFVFWAQTNNQVCLNYEKCAIPGLFFLYFRHVNTRKRKLPMNGFELRISGCYNRCPKLMFNLW